MNLMRCKNNGISQRILKKFWSIFHKIDKHFYFLPLFQKRLKLQPGEILFEPKIISIEKKKRLIKQKYCVIDERKRDIALTKLLEIEDINKCIIFCRTKREVDRLSTYLQSLGFNAKGIHGSLEQIDREEIYQVYIEMAVLTIYGSYWIIASRGLDIRGLLLMYLTYYYSFLTLQSYIPQNWQGQGQSLGKLGKAFTLGIYWVEIQGALVRN